MYLTDYAGDTYTPTDLNDLPEPTCTAPGMSPPADDDKPADVSAREPEWIDYGGEG